MKVSRRSFKVEVPSVAMGDIAFNLLVFFVILAKAQDDAHLQWNPAKTTTVEAAKKARVGIVVDVDSKLYLNGHAVDQMSLADAVEKALGTAGSGERTVLLKIDKQAQALTFEKVLEAVSKAGGEIIHILDKKEG
ncbi:MAG: biopolymer transporter ExbD [Planctomycetia bacterium]|nr:biopolymer transporter ExbD [Planctomycetia bacterium]